MVYKLYRKLEIPCSFKYLLIKLFKFISYEVSIYNLVMATLYVGY